MQSAYKDNKGTTGNRYEVLIYILGWYVSSLSISVYNKWMFGDGLNFKFPILITAFHQFCLIILSGLVLYFDSALRPKTSSLSGPTLGPGFFACMFSIPLSNYIREIVPCGLASAGDIGLSNFSLKFVTLSLYTMTKTTSLIFVLFFGLLFRLEKFNWRLIFIVSVMSISVLMMIKKPSDRASTASTDSNSNDSGFGIFLVLAASMASGLRWSFTQLLLKNHDHTTNSISTIFYVSPSMCVILFIFGLFIEGWSNFISSPIWQEKGVLKTIFLMIIPGVLAFLMTFSEFKLLSVAKVTTLSIAGIFKELLTILFGSLIFGDKLTLLNTLGIFITFLDILWYNYYRLNESSSTEEIQTSRFSSPDEESSGSGRSRSNLEMKLL